MIVLRSLASSMVMRLRSMPATKVRLSMVHIIFFYFVFLEPVHLSSYAIILTENLCKETISLGEAEAETADRLCAIGGGICPHEI